MSSTNDLQHFTNLEVPLAPSDNDVVLYKTQLPTRGNVLLLGYTSNLLPLATESLDLNPPPGCRTIRGDWFEVEQSYDAIIGDGVLNLSGPTLLDALLPKTKLFITRFFMVPIPGMKYATYFRKNSNFLREPDVMIDTEDPRCKILVWKRTR